MKESESSRKMSRAPIPNTVCCAKSFASCLGSLSCRRRPFDSSFRERCRPSLCREDKGTPNKRQQNLARSEKILGHLDNFFEGVNLKNCKVKNFPVCAYTSG
nr:hypothetical protein MarQu_412 [Marseillevirus sp.]